MHYGFGLGVSDWRAGERKKARSRTVARACVWACLGHHTRQQATRTAQFPWSAPSPHPAQIPLPGPLIVHPTSASFLSRCRAAERRSRNATPPRPRCHPPAGRLRGHAPMPPPRLSLSRPRHMSSPIPDGGGAAATPMPARAHVPLIARTVAWREQEEPGGGDTYHDH